ncbi:unnamed protein product [Echinostoma caproni]|uniref:Uncharacterized protein n=1 Tax=Echinostoma caproni TaxID=27848 RepID=A0A183AKP0_9TREM|nr:unnamed protein product [Echinostoma caproni]
MHALLTQRHHIGASSHFRQYPFQRMNRTAEKKTNPDPEILGASLEPEYYFKTTPPRTDQLTVEALRDTRSP